jgi:hypothetical protein
MVTHAAPIGPKKKKPAPEDTGFIKSVPSKPFAMSKNLLITRWELVSAALGFPMMLVGLAHRDRESPP